jgi:hypothetical protein
MAEQLIEALFSGFKAGKDTDGGGFKPEIWVEVTENVNKAWKGKGRVSEESCRNKWQWFKDYWKLWKVFAGMSGFGWSEEEELYKADKDVWDNLAKSYRNIKWHKNNVLPFRDILGDILDHAQATGAGAFSTQQNELADEIGDDLGLSLANIDPTLVEIDRASTASVSSTPRPQALSRTQSQLSLQVGTPGLMYSRSKSRLREGSDDEDSRRPKKKVELALAVINMTEEMVKDRERKEKRDNAPERAIEILYSTYENRMDDLTFIEALNFFTSEKARLFLRIRPGPKRDLWLERALGIELLRELED